MQPSKRALTSRRDLGALYGNLIPVQAVVSWHFLIVIIACFTIINSMTPGAASRDNPNVGVKTCIGHTGPLPRGRDIRTKIRPYLTMLWQEE